jgi:hypothetical protein
VHVAEWQACIYAQEEVDAESGRSRGIEAIKETKKRGSYNGVRAFLLLFWY